MENKIKKTQVFTDTCAFLIYNFSMSSVIEFRI